MKTIWIGHLDDKFGYDLEVAAETEKECRDALLKEYVRAYKRRNGCHPKTDYYYGERSNYEVAKDEIFVYEAKLGEVEWT